MLIFTKIIYWSGDNVQKQAEPSENENRRIKRNLGEQKISVKVEIINNVKNLIWFKCILFFA